MLNSRICQMLGIRYPVFQGGMAWIADYSLASAVSNAGGLGIIAAANAPAEWVRTQIRKTRELTSGPFGVNIMLLSPDVDAVIDVVCSERVAVVTTGAGNPGKYMARFKDAGIKVIPVVPAVALAKRLEQAGADAVIAEGGESGGHVGEMTTMALVPQVVDSVSIPVVAAGGIADGRGAAAAFCLGAEAVQLGTRFLVARECTVHDNFKQKVLGAKDTDTAVCGRPTGHPVRVLKNRLSRQFEQLEARCAASEEYDSLGSGKLALAVRDGDVDNGSVMAGQIAGLVKREETAREIIEEIMNDAAATLHRLCGRLDASERRTG